jgi:hypothetical protein
MPTPHTSAFKLEMAHWELDHAVATACAGMTEVDRLSVDFWLVRVRVALRHIV